MRSPRSLRPEPKTPQWTATVKPRTANSSSTRHRPHFLCFILWMHPKFEFPLFPLATLCMRPSNISTLAASFTIGGMQVARVKQGSTNRGASHGAGRHRGSPERRLVSSPVNVKKALELSLFLALNNDRTPRCPCQLIARLHIIV